MKTFLHIRRSISRPPLRWAFVLVALADVSLSPPLQAVSPPPDGGYPGGNTAKGQNALLSLTAGTFNTAVGLFSLQSLTDGKFNTGMGAGTLFANTADENTAAGAGALFSNTTGFGNTANGSFALSNNTTGTQNVAIGWHALQTNITGNFNTAIGFRALISNTADNNTATGINTLISNTVGTQNTADGGNALQNNINASNSTAIGFNALLSNTSGGANTAIGSLALDRNSVGNFNTATGADALFSNTTGDDNTASGFEALINNTTGARNTAIGSHALFNNDTGTDNIALGLNAGANVSAANNVICIGSQVSGVDVSNSCFIGNIRGVPTGIGDAVSVIIDSNGQLGTISSSRQFKKDIKPMDEASEAILALKPVTFHYKNDKTTTPQFGLIAEEVAEVNPDLVARGKNGEIYTVRYEAVNAMLLNEFLKEHKKMETQASKINNQQATVAELKLTVVQQQKAMEVLTAELSQQASQIQRMSAQIELSKAGTKAAANP